MHAHWLVLLGIALALFAPSAAAETETPYSLKQLRALARAAHPTLEAADAALEAAAGGLRQARAYSNPEIAVAFGRGRPRDGGGSRSESTIELVQPVEMPGLRRWRTRSAELGTRSAELERGLAETLVDSTVSRLVYSVLLSQRRAEIARDSADVALRLRRLLERRVELGESSPLEAIRARSEWFARRREVALDRSAAAAARSALKLFCGERLPDDFGIAETLRGPEPGPLPADLFGRLIARNPVLLRAGVGVEQAQARTEIARRAALPRIDLSAGRVSELDRTATSVGVGLAIPLWNRHRGQVAEAAGEKARASADRRALSLELERELAHFTAAYAGALEALRLHEEGWTATAAEALAIATFSFENGEASLLDVLDALRSDLAVRSAEAESWAALALARAEIERLTGPLEPEDPDEHP